MKKSEIIEIIIGIMFIVLMSMAICLNVKAGTYTNDNISSNTTQINQLYDMANNQIKDIETKKYVSFIIGYDYYLVIGKDYEINNNRITMNNTTIFKAIRTQQSNYNYYYAYSKTNETQTIINANYILYTNINITNGMRYEKQEEYNKIENLKKGIIFIIAIAFAILLMKGRNK